MFGKSDEKYCPDTRKPCMGKKCVEWDLISDSDGKEVYQGCMRPYISAIQIQTEFSARSLVSEVEATRKQAHADHESATALNVHHMSIPTLIARSGQ